MRAAPAAPALLGAYVVWTYLSVVWAQSPGVALDGANRTLLYFCVFVLACALPIRAAVRAAVAATWSAAVGALGGAALVAAASAATPEGHFVLGRLAAPISYPDADAALFLAAALPLLVLSSRRELGVPARAAAAAAAAALVDLAVLAQSRASAVALPLTLIVLIAVGRRALRTLLHAAIAAAAVAPAAPALLDVYRAVVAGAGWHHAIARAGAWIAVSTAVAAALTAAAAHVDRRTHIAETTYRRTCAALATVAAAGAVAAIVGVFALGHPARWAQTAWSDFTHNKHAQPRTIHLASGLGTSRYDVWRVALDQFAAHPLTGTGADNFIAAYLRHRRTTEVARYPESVEIRTLSETGIVGALLGLGFLAVVLWRAVAGARRSPGDGLALACLAGGLYWLVHASVDWFWEIPALTAPALVLLAFAGAAEGSPARERGVSRRVALAGAALVAVLAATLAVPWIAVRLTDRAVALAGGARAYALLHEAARLDPLSEQPALAEATLAANAGDRPREVRALHAASARDPADWYPWFMLGIVAGREHRPAAARALLARAHRMSPRDLVVVYAQRRLRWGRPLTEREVGRILLEVSSTLRGASQR